MARSAVGTLPRMPTAARHLARVGLAAKGVLYVLLAVLALRLAFGDKADADAQGALRAIAGEPLGTVMLGALSLGFAIYAGWQWWSAWTADKTFARIGAVGRGVVWSGLAISAARFIVQAGTPPKQEESLTARLLDLPFGPWLIAAGGAAAIIIGIVFLRHLKDHRYLDNLKTLPARTQTAVKTVTVTGIFAKSLVYALVGGFLIRAAVRHKANSGIGLDGALGQLSQAAYGTYALVALAFGLAAYAAWCWVRAAYENVRESNG